MTEERQKLVTDNLGFAHMIANRYRSMNLEFDDIVSVAYVGLVRAANAFDPDRGFKFTTFAAKVITNEILYYARRQKKTSA